MRPTACSIADFKCLKGKMQTLRTFCVLAMVLIALVLSDINP